MTYVVTGNCVDCKYTDCAEVCPVEAFHEAEDRLYINPDVCIDCDACVPMCPVEAIFPEDDVPEDQQAFTAENAEKAADFPTIVEKKRGLKGENCVDPNAGD
jgi:ferredoxin